MIMFLAARLYVMFVYLSVFVGLLLGQLVIHSGPEWNISNYFITGVQRMKPIDFGAPQTFPLVVPRECHECEALTMILTVVSGYILTDMYEPICVS